MAPELVIRTAVCLEGLPDSEVLRVAAADGLVLVSQDRDTMPGHFRDFTRHTESPGVVLLRPRTPIRVAIEELVLIWMAVEVEEFRNRLVWIPL